eukprot:3038487-Amphidinium_carterae.1
MIWKFVLGGLARHSRSLTLILCFPIGVSSSDVARTPLSTDRPPSYASGRVPCYQLECQHAFTAPFRSSLELLLVGEDETTLAVVLEAMPPAQMQHFGRCDSKESLRSVHPQTSSEAHFLRNTSELPLCNLSICTCA